MDAKTFGAFVAELRKEKQMTQAQLAEKLHVTDKAVSRWERGVGLPDLANLEPLADSLGISVSELIRCRRQADTDTGKETASQLVEAMMEIAKYQRRVFVERIFAGIVFFVVGAIFLFWSVHMLTVPGFSAVIGGADGPTSIWVAGRVPRKIPVAGMILGGACILVSVWLIVRTVRKMNRTD